MMKIPQLRRLIIMTLIAVNTVAVSAVDASAKVLNLPNEELIDQHGEKFHLADLRGIPLFLAFVYSRCPMPEMCPMTMNLIKSLLKTAKMQGHEKDLRVLIMTLDPENDTPPVLKAMADRFAMNDSAVRLATGTAAAIANVTSVFGVASYQDGGAISHRSFSALIDADQHEFIGFEDNAWKPAEILRHLKKNPSQNNTALADIKDHKDKWKTQTFTLDGFEVDKTYLAMSGPTKKSYAKLNVTPGVKHYWIKGFKVEVYSDKNTSEPLYNLCHAWLTLRDPKIYTGNQGLLTISEGMGSLEFPAGYAMLGTSDLTDGMELLAQVLNDDETVKKTFGYRFSITYVEDPGEKPSLFKPLIQRTIAAMGEPVKVSNGLVCAAEGAPGAKSSGHFLVPPGISEFKNTIPGTKLVSSKRRVKFIKIHLHRYGSEIKLFDKSTGKLLWSGMAHYKNGQIDNVDSYSSTNGFELDPSHQYEIKAYYHNPTDTPVDGMASLRMYVEGLANDLGQ